jgi:hypothetical protein
MKEELKSKIDICEQINGNNLFKWLVLNLCGTT